MTDTAKRHYARHLFGLPVSQIRYLGELNEAQLNEVRRYFFSGLVNCDQYVYAVKRDGHLIWRRERRDLLLEATS